MDATYVVNESRKPEKTRLTDMQTVFMRSYMGLLVSLTKEITLAD